ncbi:hypothetical protein PoB_004570000 [Plakobranchus ocellatus]|uniref:Uncharacterized protein n=1 Tax=Plakobranchus ocellatus TaxID=259542 RepID=A0AAV4BF31_9GAST|nr:hypothetical protein PoB_004570000 [Plakobranchus ocellatus]
MNNPVLLVVFIIDIHIAEISRHNSSLAFFAISGVPSWRLPSSLSKKYLVITHLWLAWPSQVVPSCRLPSSLSKNYLVITHLWLARPYKYVCSFKQINITLYFEVTFWLKSVS